MLQFFSRFAAFGEAVCEDDAGFNAFSTGLLDDGNDRLIVDGDDRESDFAGHVSDAGIGFQTKNFRTARIDRNNLRLIETHVLQVLENIHRVMIALAGADDRETIGFKERC